MNRNTETFSVKGVDSFLDSCRLRTLKTHKGDSKMSKVTIATAVLAGLAISDRLQELTIVDDVLFEEVGNLAGALGAVMQLIEQVDVATGIVLSAVEASDQATALKGLTAIKAVTSDLVSDQDKVNAALGMTEEEQAIFALMAALGMMKR
jgi:hypothetical protein